jgi:hypothetical protein
MWPWQGCRGLFHEYLRLIWYNNHNTGLEVVAMYSDNPDFDVKFENAFGPISFTANRHLIEHMIRVRRSLGIDYDTMLIWGVLAHLNVAHMLPPGKTKSLIEIENEHKNPITGMRPLRLRDLEQVTRLPRETIRRKLSKLQKKSYILQIESGWIINRDAIGPEMREFTRVTILRFLESARTIIALLDASPVEPSRKETP